MDALTAHVQGRIGEAFEWGKCDCLTFANEALRAHLGHGPFDQFIPHHYDNIGEAIRIYASWQKRSPGGIVQNADELWRREFTLYPAHGMLVGRPVENGRPLAFSFGVVVNGMCAMVSQEKGVAIVPPVVQDMFWRVT